jgi:hypothetical protein
MIRYRIPAGSSGSSSSKQDLIHVKERRYVAKILTIILRDFQKILIGGKKANALKFMLEKVWELCEQNLNYLLPFYIDSVLCPHSGSLMIED